MILHDYKKTALIFKEDSFSYKELIALVNLFASKLDVKRGDNVLLFSQNSMQWVVSLFAIWQKGAVAVPIDYKSAPSEVAYFLKDSDAALAIVSQECREIFNEALSLSDAKVDLQIIEEIEQAEAFQSAQNEPDDEIAQAQNDTALILYTSGTTGDPKGVMLSFKNLLSNIESIKEKKIISEHDVLLALLPFHHSYPLMTTLLVPLSLGATVVLQQKLSSEEIIATMQKNGVSILVGVPRLFDLFHKGIVDKIEKSLVAKLLFRVAKSIDSQNLGRTIFRKVHERFGGKIRYFISGGAKLDVEVANDFHSMGFAILEGYGLTETSPIVAFNSPGNIRLGSVGRPITLTKVKIEEGEVLISGDNLMQGYYKKEEKSKEAIKNGWFYSGDLGHIDSDGFLYITGRKKDMIVLPSGKNINPEDIEKEIVKISEYVKEAAVIHKGAGLLAIIHPDKEALKKDEKFNIRETIKWKVIDRYNQKASSYSKILDFRLIDTELPKTRLGKLKRFKLHEMLKEDRKEAAVKKPQDETYRLLEEFLHSVTAETIDPLGHLEIDLGIDSLGKIELQSFIESSFGIEIDDTHLAEFENLNELYLYIKNMKNKIDSSRIEWREFLSKESFYDIYDKSGILRTFTAIISPFMKSCFSLKVKGIENLPKSPFILAANHQSMLDPFLLSSILPKDVLINSYALGIKDFFDSFISRNLGRYAHVVVVDYNADLKESMKKSAFLLKKGKNLLIFPEGARSRDGEIKEFKKFFAILAKSLDVPIVPVTIKGAYKALPAGSHFPKPQKISIVFHKPLYAQGLDYEEISQKVRSIIQNETE